MNPHTSHQLYLPAPAVLTAQQDFLQLTRIYSLTQLKSAEAAEQSSFEKLQSTFAA